MLSGLLVFLDDGTGMAFALCLIVAGLIFYFLPSVIAASRHVANSYTGIVLVNLFLGWTLIGWLAALIWACTAETKAQAQLREMAFAQMARGYAPPAPAAPIAQTSGAAYQAGAAAGEMARMSSPRKVLLGVFAIIAALALGFSVMYHFAEASTAPAATHNVSTH